jgi:hypothetical protein
MALDLAGLIAGPIVGFLGGLVNQVAAYKNKKLDIEFETTKFTYQKEMAQIQYTQAVELTRLEQEGRERITQMEGEITLKKEDYASLRAALDADRATYLPQSAILNNSIVVFMLAVVDSTRGLVRPIITGFLVWSLWRLSTTTMAAVSTLNIGQRDQLLANVTEATTFGIVQLALTAIGYWFGSRSSIETFTKKS